MSRNRWLKGRKTETLEIYHNSIIEFVKLIEKGEPVPEALYFTLLKRRQIDRGRKEKAKHNQVFHYAVEASEVPQNWLGQSKSPEKVLIDKESLQKVRRFLEKLGKNCKEILLMDADGFSNKEISAVLNLTLGTVKSRKSQCRADLFRK